MYTDLEYTLDRDDTADITLVDFASFLKMYGYDLGVEGATIFQVNS